MSYDVLHVLATKRNAREIVTLIGEDLRRAGLPDTTVARIANPANHGHVGEQQRKLRGHPGRYLGAFVGGMALEDALLTKPVGVIKIGHWRKADQQPYAGSEAERRELQYDIGARQHDFPHRPLGIFALLVTGVLPPDGRLEVADSLVEAAVKKAGSSEMRIGLDASDPFVPVLEQKGFGPTGVYGEHFKIPHQLYIRPGALGENETL